MSVVFDPEQFARNAKLVARLARADDLFGLLRRRVSVPQGCTAIVWRAETAPTVYAAGTEMPGDGAREIMLVRTAPLELQFAFDRLLSKDGFDFAATVQCQVFVVPQREDLVSFRTGVLGSHDSADVERVRLVCAETVHGAMGQFAREHEADVLADPAQWSGFDAVLAQRFKPVGFSTGLALGRDPRISLTSESYATSQRARQTARLRQERLDHDAKLRAATVEARKSRLSELETLVAQARAIAEQAGGAGVAELIRSFDPAQRGEFYRGLLAANKPSKPTTAVIAIAGDEALFFDPADPRQPSKRIDLSGPLGGLRSIQWNETVDGGEIVIGAGRGVHRLTREGNKTASHAVASDVAARGGFNAMARLDNAVYGTHSELGIWRWQATGDAPGEACLGELTAGSKTIRCIQPDAHGRLWFAVDETVFEWRPDAATPPRRWTFPSTVTALLAADGSLFIALADGRVLHRPHLDDDSQERIFGPGGTIDDLSWSPGGGAARLILANGMPQAHMVIVGDASRADYRAPTGIRSATATEDFIAGITQARDQIALWRMETPEEPAAMIPVSRICGRSIQDVMLLS